MTQYMLSVFYEEGAPEMSADEMQQMGIDVDEVQRRSSSRRALGCSAPVSTQPSSATVVNAKDGDVTTTDGPYPESKEQLGGFWILQAPDLDAVLALAATASAACRGPVEVRPLHDEPAA